MKNEKYVTLPAKIGDNYCSPHLSGGAIDLTLFEIASGKELEMGTPFDDCTEKAHRDYFEQLTELTLEEKISSKEDNSYVLSSKKLALLLTNTNGGILTLVICSGARSTIALNYLAPYLAIKNGQILTLNKTGYRL